MKSDEVFNRATLKPAGKHLPEPAEPLAIVELSDIQFDALAEDAPMAAIGDQLMRPRFLPNTVTDCCPVVSATDPNCEDMRGGLNEITDEIVPNIPDALAATDNDLEAPEATF